MNPHAKVFAGLRVNGATFDWGEIELRYVPRKLAEWVIESPLATSDFSSLDLRLSKRPIHWESKSDSAQAQDLIALHMIQDADDIAIDAIGDITFGEVEQLQADPIWTRYRDWLHDPSRFTQDESQGVKAEWRERYKGSKYERLMG